MEYREYDTLPFKTFYKLLQDDTNLSALGIPDKKESRKVWKNIKQEWQELNPSVKNQQLTSAYIKIAKETARMKKDLAFLKFTLNSSTPQRELYEELGYEWIEDDFERVQATIDQIEKAKGKMEIFTERFKKLEKDLEEDSKNQDAQCISDINAGIASLEMAGATIPNYEKLTCGQYDALTKVINKKINNG